MDHIRGIQHDAVSAWFEANVPGVALPLTFELIAGGHSNLTFKATDANGQCYVLRRPPLYQVLATAHDMGREHKIIAALADTDVPVPRTHGLCEDEAVNERPFYVMEFVDGRVVRNRNHAAALAPEVRRAASTSIAETLAHIHAVDVDEVGLGDLGRKEDYIARQLRRWLRQFEESKTQDRPQIQEVHDHLVARIPEQGEAGIVHGDYRLDNCILGSQGQVMAVLDWELCTLGDRNADVAQLLVYWAEPDDPESALDDPPTSESGIRQPSRDVRPLLRGVRARNRQLRVLHGLRLLEAGLHSGGRVQPIRGRGDGRQGAAARGRELRCPGGRAG